MQTGELDRLKSRLYWVARREDLEKENLFERDRQAYWALVIPEVEKRYLKLLGDARERGWSTLSIPPKPKIEPDYEESTAQIEATRKRDERLAFEALRECRKKKKKKSLLRIVGGAIAMRK